MNKFQLYLSFRLSERSERTEKSTFNKLSPFRKGSCSNVVGFMNSLSFRLSERSERTEKSTFNKLSPFRKGSCSNVVGFMNSLSFRLSERSERTETKKSFPRGKLGPRSSAG